MGLGDRSLGAKLSPNPCNRKRKSPCLRHVSPGGTTAPHSSTSELGTLSAADFVLAGCSREDACWYGGGGGGGAGQRSTSAIHPGSCAYRAACLQDAEDLSGGGGGRGGGHEVETRCNLLSCRHPLNLIWVLHLQRVALPTAAAVLAPHNGRKRTPSTGFTEGKCQEGGIT